MSRLSGFSAYVDKQSVFDILWKNYLELDAVIWSAAFDNHAVEDRSTSEDTTILVFNSPAAFKTVIAVLEKRIAQGFTGDEIMIHTAEEATDEWKIIMDKIHSFINTLDILARYPSFPNELQIIFFSCN